MSITNVLKNAEEEISAEEQKNAILIKGKWYKINLLPSEDGLELWEILMQKLLPSVGSGLDGMNHDAILDGSPTTFSEAFMHLSNKLDGNTLKLVSLNVLKGMTVDGVKVDQNKFFAGNYGTWLKVIKFALQENYSSFFEEGWTSALKDVMGMVNPLSEQEGTAS